MKIGDIVICVDNVVNGKTDEISLNKTYTLIDSYKLESIYCTIINDNNIEGDYFKRRFISLKEYRKKKLKRILNESN